MKRRLQRIYWTGIACTLTMAMIAVSLLVLTRIQDKFDSLRSTLQTASAWTLESQSELQTHAVRIASVSPPVRVTFLDAEGKVLADSQEDASIMENHLDRPEIQAAQSSDIGKSLRISDTQSVFMLYAAKRIAPDLILRLGYPIEMITRALLFYSIGIVLLFCVLLVLQRRSLSRFTDDVARQLDEVRLTLEGGEEPKRAIFPELQPGLDNISYLAGRLSSDLNEVRRTLTLRSDFVARASHELRSPLTSVMGFAEMLDEGIADTPEEQEICLRTIRSECERMLDVVEDVLLLSRAEREQGLEKTQVNVRTVTEEVCRALTPQADQKGIRLEASGELTVTAVEKDIWEILHNLAGNAIRYGKTDGFVRISLSENTISVQDNGIGIAAEHLPHLFEQFYRVDESRDPTVRGTGLGLSIVRTLAERNDACVEVESELGQGSIFTVLFA